MLCDIDYALNFCVGARKIAGRPCATKAIVLVPLGTGIDNYLSMIRSPFLETSNGIPNSVHFTVSMNGEIAQYVELGDTALGILNYSTPTYPDVPTLPANALIEEYNCPFIFVGVEVPQILTGAIPTCPDDWTMGEYQEYRLARLICCLMKTYGLVPTSLSIITGFDLNSNLIGYPTLSPTLIPLVVELSQTNCVKAGSGTVIIPPPIYPPTTNPSGCTNCGDSSCCPEHTNLIQVQDNRIARLTAQFTELETLVNSFNGRLLSVVNQLTALGNSNAQIMAKFEEIEACFRCLCSGADNDDHIEYELSGSENWQVLVPFAPTKLRMPIQISDTSPAQVIPTTYWIAQLRNGCTQNVEIDVTLANAEYEAGKEVWVDMVYCNNRHKIATVSPSGSGSVTLHGVYSFTPLNTPCEVYFEVFTSDNLTPTKIIEYAKVKISCV